MTHIYALRDVGAIWAFLGAVMLDVLLHLRSELYRPGDSHCAYCKYDLAGLPTGVCCPECGKSQPGERRRRVRVWLDLPGLGRASIALALVWLFLMAQPLIWLAFYELDGWNPSGRGYFNGQPFRMPYDGPFFGLLWAAALMLPIMHRAPPPWTRRAWWMVTLAMLGILLAVLFLRWSYGAICWMDRGWL